MTAVTAGHPLPHHESVDTVGRRWRTGVVLLMVADVAFVASLVFTYFYLRGLNTQGAWFPKGASVAPIWVGWAIAAALVASAATYRWGEIGMRAGNESRLVAAAGVAVVLVLADAVYLKAKWQEEFEAEESFPGTFHRANGKGVSTEFMYQVDQFRYGSGPGYKAVELPYRDSTLSLLAVLPVGNGVAKLDE